ncbi:MAG TPA: hypothetical protein VMW77_04810 [Methanoregula sp.]|nr:hypothetical protein [Methanoregula sp.]
MAKRLQLTTRAFGAEPGVPDVAALATWIAEHRGMTADIVTYLLDQSLAPQLPAGIMSPCAGGRFYSTRIMECLVGIEGGKATGEIHLNPHAIIEDAAGIVVQKKGAWCALPAPHWLGIRDSYYHDEAEWNDAITGTYRELMRSMRDTGIRGHVLICDRLREPEIESLVRQNVFFFQPEPDREGLASLMEHQRQIAVGRDHIDTVLDLSSEYDLRKIIIIDPDQESIERALACLDPDQVSVGGYCTAACDDYWKNLVDAAVYTLR